LAIEDHRPRLKKGVGLVGVVTFGAGTAIGVSIFSVLAPAAKIAGSGLLATVGIAAVPMVLFAVIYSFLSSALPKSGASYEWPRRFIHPSVGFLVAWLRILSNVGAIVVLAMVLVNRSPHACRRSLWPCSCWRWPPSSGSVRRGSAWIRSVRSSAMAGFPFSPPCR
jgi:L-asparagine transporter-like permease